MFQFKTQLRQCERGFPGNAVVKDPPANAGGTGDLAPSLGQEDPLEEAMATHSSILDRIILWTEATVQGVAKSTHACKTVSERCVFYNSKERN